MTPLADFLATVAAKTRERVETQKQKLSFERLEAKLKDARPHRGFQKAIHRPGAITIIAELKQASPSAGVIRQEPDIPSRLQAYERGGAAALSIVTEEDYFHGSPHLLEEAREHSSLPLLRKDFIVDSYQIIESKTLGADAILLIAPLLPGGLLAEFIALARSAGLETLVEVHDAADLERAVLVQAPVIGINNRNLRTLRVDRAVGAKLLALAPKKGVTLVVESGIQTPDELPHLRTLGAHAVLIGETFMRAEDPESLVKEFSHVCLK